MTQYVYSSVTDDGSVLFNDIFRQNKKRGNLCTIFLTAQYYDFYY